MDSQDPHNTPMDDLTVCYTTFNSMRTMPQSLDAARTLAKHIVVIDSGSTDGTIELCQSHGIEPTHRDWTTPTEQKTFAMSFCGETPWTLLLDSDETVLDDLVGTIRQALANAEPDDCGFELNRVTWLDGKPLRHTFQPEWRLRLVRSDAAVIKSDPSGVHDHIELTRGQTHRIEGTLRHDSWADAGDMLARGVQWGVKTGRAAKRGGRVMNLCFNPAWSFLKQLLLKRAILDGWRGWVAAAGVASQTLCKHIAIMERRGQQRENDRKQTDSQPAED